MSKHSVTRNQLYLLNRDVQQIAQSGSIMSFWHESKIREFFNQNGVRVQSTIDKVTEIFNKYHEIVDNKPVMVTPEATEENPNPKPIPKLKEFFTNEGFVKERDEYLNEIVEITI